MAMRRHDFSYCHTAKSWPFRELLLSPFYLNQSYILPMLWSMRTSRGRPRSTPAAFIRLAACRRQEGARRPRLGARIEARGRRCTTMIDLAALGGLFVDVFGISKEWSTPKMIRFEHLDDILHEKVVRDLEAEGHELIWVREARLRPLQREGWKPVIERDKFGRPSIFVDRREELVLVHRAPQAGA